MSPRSSRCLFDVILPALPEIAAGAVDEDDGHGDALAGLHEREDFEAFVHRAEAAGEERDRVAGADEHQLAGEEVFEVDQLGIVGDERVGGLLEGQADRQAEGRIGARAAVPRGHDPAAGAGDDHPPRGGHRLAERAAACCSRRGSRACGRSRRC